MATTENYVFGNGGNTYSFSFPYLKTEDVRVEFQEFDSTQTPGNQIISRSQNTAFTIPPGNPTTIVFDAIGASTTYQTSPNGNVRVTSTNGYPVRIRIYRATQADATPSTFFAGSAIRAQDLNDNFDQILYIMQEKENALLSIQTGGIGDNVIATSALQDDSVDASKLRDSVSTDAERAVTTNHIRNNAVTTAKLAANAVTAVELANDAVDTAAILDSAVTTAKIADSNITTDKIVNSAVTTAKIADSNVTTIKIADSNVTEAKLANSSVTVNKIADSTITAAKFVTSVAEALLPPGMVQFYAANTAPSGWLKANGAAVDRTTYAALFAAIGTTYGVGDGSTTFNLPDLRGEFPRGWDDGRGVDTSRAFGSAQAQAFLSHSHGVSDPGHAHAVYDPGHVHSSTAAGTSGSPDFVTKAGNSADRVFTTGAAATGIGIYGAATGISIAANGGTETRPRNVALLACIKY